MILYTIGIGVEKLRKEKLSSRNSGSYVCRGS
jgi:hypothetical protein